MLRRLNRLEYEYTIEDLFGVRGDFTEGFPADAEEEGFGVRLEDDFLIGKDENINLMESIPIEAEEIEELMNAEPAAIEALS